jgi:hypothetical protein
VNVTSSTAWVLYQTSLLGVGFTWIVYNSTLEIQEVDGWLFFSALIALCGYNASSVL